MPIILEKPVEGDARQTLERVVNQINYLARPGDPILREGRHRSWQKCIAWGLDKVKAPDLDRRENVERLAQETFRAKGKDWSWRYLVNFSSQDCLYATFDNSLKIIGLSRGPEAALAVQAARELRSLPEIADLDYELRVLTLPGLLTEAFWLWRAGNAPPEPAGGYIVPFFTCQDLRCGYPYQADKFFKLAAEMAKLRTSQGLEETGRELGKRANIKDEDDAEAKAIQARLKTAARNRLGREDAETSAQKDSWGRASR
jgi:hypothetical protein